MHTLLKFFSTHETHSYVQKRFTQTLLHIVCLIISLPFIALAEDTSKANSYLGHVRGFSGILEAIPAAESLHQQELAKVNIKGSVFLPRLGRVRLEFDRERIFDKQATFASEHGQENDLQGIRLLRGEILLRNSSSPLAGAIYYREGKPYLYSSFLGRSSRRKTARYYSLEIPLSNEGRLPRRAHISRSILIGSKAGNCPGSIVQENSQAKLSPATRPSNRMTKTKILELSLEGDRAWFQKFGKGSGQASKESKPEAPKNPANLVILQIVNAAESIYEKQLDITFKIKRLNTYKDIDFGNNNAQNKLIAYQFFAGFEPYYGSADFYHLFTGENLDQDAKGIAFQGSICTTPFNSFGLSKYINKADTPISFAHEIAHSFGATHDDSQPPSIMHSNANTATNATEVFSNKSIKEISDYIATTNSLPGGSCVAAASTGPEPTPQATANPNPNPTTSPPNGQSRSIALQASVSKKGDFRIQVDVDSSSTTCTVALKGATSEASLYSSATLVKYTPNQTQTSLSTKLARKTAVSKKKTKNKEKKKKKKKKSKKSSKGGKQKTFIGAELQCQDGSTTQSQVVRIKPESVKSKKKGLSPGKWLKAVAKKLSKQL